MKDLEGFLERNYEEGKNPSFLSYVVGMIEGVTEDDWKTDSVKVEEIKRVVAKVNELKGWV